MLLIFNLNEKGFFFVATVAKQSGFLIVQALGSHLKPALGGCKLNLFFSIPGNKGLGIEPSCATVLSAARSHPFLKISHDQILKALLEACWGSLRMLRKLLV